MFTNIGEAAVLASMLKAGENFKDGLRKSAYEAGNHLVRAAQLGMDSSASPAPPGRYPGNVSGNLRSSISYNVSPNALYFKTNNNHAQLLEYGTGKMMARPVVQTAVHEERGFVDKVLKNKAGRLLPLKKYM